MLAQRVMDDYERFCYLSACNQPQHAFAIVICFIPTVQKLCKDSVTDCRLDDHITTLRIPRCVKLANNIIKIS